MSGILCSIMGTTNPAVAVAGPAPAAVATTRIVHPLASKERAHTASRLSMHIAELRLWQVIAAQLLRSAAWQQQPKLC